MIVTAAEGQFPFETTVVLATVVLVPAFVLFEVVVYVLFTLISWIVFFQMRRYLDELLTTLSVISNQLLNSSGYKAPFVFPSF
ncbi:hypothetical protein D3C87_2084890 [compost metagenome]